MTAPLDTNSTHIPFDRLIARLEEIFMETGASNHVAQILSRNCAACERDGTLSHGVFRMPGYISSLRCGSVDGQAAPRMSRVSPAFLRVDAANGFAQPALNHALPHIEAAIAECGVVVVAVRHSHHFSALWPDIEPFADKGLAALTMVTGGPAVMPRGASSRVLGTNPIAFATPVDGSVPLIMDFATSAISHGDLCIARNEGRRVPVGTGIGRDGRDTDDPGEILDEGGILPFGGYKGAALSILVEILASALTGGPFSHEVDLSATPGAETPRTGQILILIDPKRGGNNAFGKRVSALVDLLRHSGMQRLPGDRRLEFRARAARNGIPVSDGIRRLFTCMP
ncbi:MAG: Ldh family oxidoreductase [Rhizobiaceae bacterium]